MKTMPILIAMLLAGSAVAQSLSSAVPSTACGEVEVRKAIPIPGVVYGKCYSENGAVRIPPADLDFSASRAGSASGGPIFTEEDMHRISQENREFYDRLSSGPKMSDTIRSNDEACRPTKVDYSIITLPDGKTASVLTFKD